MKRLIFVPTYNEQENASRMYSELVALGLDSDILFLDDNSPDGTGEVLDRLAGLDPRLFVLHRAGKEGIGGAHIDGIAWAYDHGYDELITLECDFSHSPGDIPRLLQAGSEGDLVVGSRYLKAGSLHEWNLFRRILTRLGHFLTKNLLGMPQDATGAFRLYRLSRIPRELFHRVQARGYAFFFESLFVMARAGLKIEEVAIVLPARTYGHSKMSSMEALRSVIRLFALYLKTGRVRQVASLPAVSSPEAEWDQYWSSKQTASHAVYDRIATLYRNGLIRPGLTGAMRRHFAPSSRLLHAGCGSGQVDTAIGREMKITALDISAQALGLYRRHNLDSGSLTRASVFELPFLHSSFDGAYNLGVIEHFDKVEILRMLSEMGRVLKPGGKIVLFWPHDRGSSVTVLRIVHWFLHRVARKNIHLHPPEISLLRSKKHAAETLAAANFELIEYTFGPRDGFVQAIVVGAMRNMAV